MSTQTASKPRSRIPAASFRTPDAAVPAVTVEDQNTREMRRLAIELATANRERAEADKRVRDATKALSALMAETGKSALDPITVEIDGQTRIIETTYELGEKAVIDVHKLRRLVDDNTFMSCVKATQGDVKSYAGDKILKQVLDKIPGDMKLTCGLKK